MPNTPQNTLQDILQNKDGRVARTINLRGDEIRVLYCENASSPACWKVIKPHDAPYEKENPILYASNEDELCIAAYQYLTDPHTQTWNFYCDFNA